MKDQPNVFLITLDALRRDHVSAYNKKEGTTPFIDKLASEGWFYENAYSTALWTDPSIASIYSGLFPSEHKVLAGINQGLEKKSIADILFQNGYETIMSGQGSGYISPSRNIVRGYNHLINTFDIKDFKTYSTDPIAKVSSLFYNSIYGRDCRIHYSLNRNKSILKNVNKPFFFHSHLWFQNQWYSVPFPIKNKYLSNSKFKDLDFKSFYKKLNKMKSKGVRVAHQYLCYPESFDQNDVEVIRALYECGVHYTDHMLCKFFSWLEKQGLIENTLFIITSDHGENLAEHGLLSHNFSCHEQIIQVPLIIWSPDFIDPDSTSNYVSLLDLKKSISEFLGVSENIQDATHSEDIFSNDYRSSDIKRPIFFEDGKPGPITDKLKSINPDFEIEKWRFATKGVIDDNWKLVLKSNGIEELYNLETDVEEMSNISDEHPEKVERLREEIAQVIGNFKPDTTTGL